jgi:hypothetical protein
MGASISCALFETFSSVLHLYVQEESKNTNILHYLDDFIFGGKAGTMQCSDAFPILCMNVEKLTMHHCTALFLLSRQK